jgi:hypothetical protein
MVGYVRLLRLTRSMRKRRQLIIPARAPPPLGGTRYARSDTIRTPLLFLTWRITWRAELIGFDERYSHFAVSCPYRVRLASLPSRPSSARRPCLAIAVQLSLTCANGNKSTHHAIRASNIGTFTKVPPDLKRFYFGHDSFRRFHSNALIASSSASHSLPQRSET